MTHEADDLTVFDADPLWRRIHPSQVVSDGQGGWRVSSAAFENSSDGSGMSTSLGRDAEAAGTTPQRALKNYQDLGMASVTAASCRSQKQTIQRDPTPDDPHHALVNGDKSKRSIRRALANAARILIMPPSRG